MYILSAGDFHRHKHCSTFLLFPLTSPTTILHPPQSGLWWSRAAYQSGTAFSCHHHLFANGANIIIAANMLAQEGKHFLKPWNHLNINQLKKLEDRGETEETRLKVWKGCFFKKSYESLEIYFSKTFSFSHFVSSSWLDLSLLGYFSARQWILHGWFNPLSPHWTFPRKKWSPPMPRSTESYLENLHWWTFIGKSWSLNVEHPMNINWKILILNIEHSMHWWTFTWHNWSLLVLNCHNSSLSTLLNSDESKLL